jgi:hypothetical protein
VDLRNAQAVARQLLTSHVDAENWGALDLLDLQVGGPADRAKDAGDSLRDGQNVLELVAEDFDGQVPTNAGEELVEAHLDGLRELVGVARNATDHLFDASAYVVLRIVGIRPLSA